MGAFLETLLGNMYGWFDFFLLPQSFGASLGMGYEYTRLYKRAML
ncbi:hypothetical protein ACMSE1_22390 [Bacteroides thetaiotaomicron]